MLLLQSLEGLQISLEHLSHCLPDLAKPQVKLVDVRDRVKKLSKVGSTLQFIRSVTFFLILFFRNNLCSVGILGMF